MKIIIILTIVEIILVLWLIHDYKNEKKNPKLMQSYHESGLSDQDITVFRATMQVAKDQIKTWEKAVKQNADLQIIEKVTGGLKSAKQLFQLIVKQPKLALTSQDFLYKQLPTMVDLVAHYEQVKGVDRLDQGLLTDNQKVIRSLSEKIAKTYATELSDDLENLKKEVENG